MQRFWHSPIFSAYVCSTIAALVSYPFLLMPLSGHPIVAGLLAGLIGGLVNRSRIRHLEFLRQRASDTHQTIWNIEVNAVKVGTMSDAELAAIELGVFSEVGNYVRQLLNLFKVLFASMDKMLVAVPLALFWGAIVLAIFAPDQFSAEMTSIHHASPADVVAVIRSTSQVFFPIWMLVLLLALSSGARLGFVNIFQEEIARQLRRRCHTAADGVVSIIRWVDGGPIFYDRPRVMQNTDRHNKSTP